MILILILTVFIIGSTFYFFVFHNVIKDNVEIWLTFNYIFFGLLWTWILNVRNGRQEEYHNNGNWKSHGEYKYGKRVGKWSFYHKNGHLKERSQFRKGKRVGKVFIFNKSGGLKEILEYSNFGNITYRENFKNGVRDGVREWYFLRSEWEEKNVILLGGTGIERSEYYKNGKLMSKFISNHKPVYLHLSSKDYIKHDFDNEKINISEYYSEYYKIVNFSKEGLFE